MSSPPIHCPPARWRARKILPRTRCASADLPSGAIVDIPESKEGSARFADPRISRDRQPRHVGGLLRPRDRGFLASVLAPGTRAVSIAVDAVSGVSGLVWPGDHVDIVLTHEIERQTSHTAP